jgi:hypothetical protein
MDFSPEEDVAERGKIHKICTKWRGVHYLWLCVVCGLFEQNRASKFHVISYITTLVQNVAGSSVSYCLQTEVNLTLVLFLSGCTVEYNQFDHAYHRGR